MCRPFDIYILNLESAPTAPRRKVAANTGYFLDPVLVCADACKHSRHVIAGGRSMGNNTGNNILQTSLPLHNQRAS